MRRKKMSNKKSRRNFTRNARPHPKNSMVQGPSLQYRGGTRL